MFGRVESGMINMDFSPSSQRATSSRKVTRIMACAPISWYRVYLYVFLYSVLIVVSIRDTPLKLGHQEI